MSTEIRQNKNERGGVDQVNFTEDELQSAVKKRIEELETEFRTPDGSFNKSGALAEMQKRLSIMIDRMSPERKAKGVDYKYSPLLVATIEGVIEKLEK